MLKKLAKLKPSVLAAGKLSPDDFFVVLDDAIRQWNPGDTIQGKIVLVLTHEQPAISVTCNLSGAIIIKNQLVKGKHSRYGLIDDTITLWSAEEDELGEEHASIEESQQPSSGDPGVAPASSIRSVSSTTTTLAPSASATPPPPPATSKLLPRGEHFFGFAFDLPRRGLYNSLEFERGSISYVITAVLQRPGYPQFTCKKNISVICPIDVSTLPVPRPSMLSIEVRKKKKETGVITSMIEIPARGYLRGDSVQVTITVNHIKPVKSVHGVVVTLSRISRVCGSGLELQSFRKDLAQTVSSLITDPNTFSQTISNKLRIPLDVFPTTTGHDMVSFQYCIEAVIDLAGKWNLKMTDDEMVGGSGGSGSGSGGLGGFLGSGSGSSSGGHGGSSRFVDTDKLKKNRGAVALWMELVIGTERGIVMNANRRQSHYSMHNYYQQRQQQVQEQHLNQQLQNQQQHQEQREHEQHLRQHEPQQQELQHQNQQEYQEHPQEQLQQHELLPEQEQHRYNAAGMYQSRHFAHPSSSSSSNNQDNNNNLIMPRGLHMPTTTASYGSSALSTPPISAEAEKERLRLEQEAAYLPSQPVPYTAAGAGRSRSMRSEASSVTGAAADASLSGLDQPSAPPLPAGTTVNSVDGDADGVAFGTPAAAAATAAVALHQQQQRSADKLERERMLLLDRSSQPYDVPAYVGPSSPLDDLSVEQEPLPQPATLQEQQPQQHQDEKRQLHEQMLAESAPPTVTLGGLESTDLDATTDEPSAPPLNDVHLTTVAHYESALPAAEYSSELDTREVPAAPPLGGSYGDDDAETAEMPSAPPLPTHSNDNPESTIQFKYGHDYSVPPQLPAADHTNISSSRSSNGGSDSTEMRADPLAAANNAEKRQGGLLESRAHRENVNVGGGGGSGEGVDTDSDSELYS